MNSEVLDVQQEAETVFDEYKNTYQKLINKYSNIIYRYFCKVRLDSLRVEMLKILNPLFAAEKAARQTNAQLDNARGATATIKNYEQQVTTGFAFLLLLVSDACSCIQKWGDFETNEDMFNRLTEKLQIPKAFCTARA